MTHVCTQLLNHLLLSCLLLLGCPAVMRNREGLGTVLKQLQTRLEAEQKALAEFQQRYKIRIMQPGEAEAEQADKKPAASKPAAGKEGKGTAGVLI